MVDKRHPFLKEPKTRSIWDDDVDGDKLTELAKTKAGRKILAKNFPNDFTVDGEPRGGW